MSDGLTSEVWPVNTTGLQTFAEGPDPAKLIPLVIKNTPKGINFAPKRLFLLRIGSTMDRIEAMMIQKASSLIRFGAF